MQLPGVIDRQQTVNDLETDFNCFKAALQHQQMHILRCLCAVDNTFLFGFAFDSWIQKVSFKSHLDLQIQQIRWSRFSPTPNITLKSVLWVLEY